LEGGRRKSVSLSGYRISSRWNVAGVLGAAVWKHWQGFNSLKFFNAYTSRSFREKTAKQTYSMTCHIYRGNAHLGEPVAFPETSGPLQTNVSVLYFIYHYLQSLQVQQRCRPTRLQGYA
jgi:hypothetical protein